jgi:hypothetical protein
MGKFIDQRDLRVSLQEGIKVHFLDDAATILNAAPGDDFKTIEQGLRFPAAMSFDDARYDIDTVLKASACRKQHLIGFSDARRRAEEDLEATAAPSLAACCLKQRVGRGTPLRLYFFHG